MLIKCEECNKMISDQASSCPNCGMPRNVNKMSENLNNNPLYYCNRCSAKIGSNKVCHLCNSDKFVVLDAVYAKTQEKVHRIENDISIPIGLYVLTAILFFPIGTGFVITSYFKQKKLLQNGQIEELKDSIAGTKMLCIVFDVVIAGILLFLLFKLRWIFYL